MKNKHFVKIFSPVISLALFGCGSVRISAEYFQMPFVSSQSEIKDSQIAAQTKSKITKIITRKRLAAKNVKFIENPDKKPNPLILVLKITQGGSSPRISLNGADYESGELIQKLQTVFKEREENGMFQAGTNRVDKRIILAFSGTDINSYNRKNIYVEDFENLIDGLHEAGIDEIYVSFA